MKNIVLIWRDIRLTNSEISAIGNRSSAITDLYSISGSPIFLAEGQKVILGGTQISVDVSGRYALLSGSVPNTAVLNDMVLAPGSVGPSFEITRNMVEVSVSRSGGSYFFESRLLIPTRVRMNLNLDVLMVTIPYKRNMVCREVCNY